MAESSVSLLISASGMFCWRRVHGMQNSLVGFGLLIILLGVSPGLFSQIHKSQVDSIGDWRGMSSLGNDELLRQTESILNRGASRFQADQSELTIRQFNFGQAQEQRADFERNKRVCVPVPEISTLETVKRAAEQGKIRLQEARQFLELVEAEKYSLERYIAQIDSVQTAAEIFTETLTALDPFLLRIRLRVEDGSLAEAMVPDSLREEILKGAGEKLIVKSSNASMQTALSSQPCPTFKPGSRKPMI